MIYKWFMVILLHNINRLLSLTSNINTFTAIVDLSRSNFSIAGAPLFQLKSAT